MEKSFKVLSEMLICGDTTYIELLEIYKEIAKFTNEPKDLIFSSELVEYFSNDPEDEKLPNIE